MKKQESISQQLLDLGFIEEATRSKKYRVFTRDGVSRKFFIGKKGAIRYGHTVSGSLSMSPSIIVNMQRKFKHT